MAGGGCLLAHVPVTGHPISVQLVNLCVFPLSLALYDGNRGESKSVVWILNLDLVLTQGMLRHA